jgi:hypothetical protein
MEMLRNAFRSGDKVPEKGIYWVHHFKHRLTHPAQIMVRVFPVCRTCGDRVRFEKADVMPLVTIDSIDIDVDFDVGEPWSEDT